MNNRKLVNIFYGSISTKRIGCISVSSLAKLIAKIVTVITLVFSFSVLVEAATTCNNPTYCGGDCLPNQRCNESCNSAGVCTNQCVGDTTCSPPPPANLEFTQILDESLSFLGPRRTNYDSVASLINLVSNVIVILAFAVSFATLAFNLIQLITSQGDPKKMEKVRRALFWSIIGMILALVVHALRSVVISMLSLGNVGFFQ